MIAATGYDWLLLGHILAAMVWIGGIVVLGAMAVLVSRRGDADAVARFTADLRRIGPLVLAPAPVVLVGLGVWMVAGSGAWDGSQTWVQLAIGAFAAAFLIGAAHQSRRAIAAERAAARGDAAEALRQLRAWAWGMAVIVALLALTTWDMVFKPGL